MPLPRPRKGEPKQKFVSRCHSEIADEYTDQSQRHAICLSQWERRKRRAEVTVEDAHALAFMPDDPYCLWSYLGPWAIKPDWFEDAISKIQKRIALPKPQSLLELEALMDDDEEAQKDTSYFTSQGVAIIRIAGSMTKGISKFGGTSTILTRRAVRLARRDPAVKSILLAIDSPGGMVAGTAELAAEVREANTGKPVRAYIEDLGASAAYWVASQAETITANKTAQIGSIGVLAILHDSSGLAERSGLTVHVISTGAYKGMGAPGSKVLPEHVAEVATQVEDLGQHFFSAVQEGRRFSQTQLARVADGRVWIAERARSLGLIDRVATFEDTLAEMARMRPRSARTTASLEARLSQIVRIS